MFRWHWWKSSRTRRYSKADRLTGRPLFTELSRRSLLGNLGVVRSSWACRMKTRERSTIDEKADREHLLDPRGGHASPGRTWRGRQRRGRARGGGGGIFGRSNGGVYGRSDEHAPRP